MLLMMLFIAIQLPAQTIQPDPEVSSSVFDLSTFTGIVAVISLIVTQLAKKIPVISTNTILKILVSVIVGIAASLLSWWLGLADFLTGLLWWQVLIQGLLAGLTACGFYDLFKGVFGKKE